MPGWEDVFRVLSPDWQTGLKLTGAVFRAMAAYAYVGIGEDTPEEYAKCYRAFDEARISSAKESKDKTDKEKIRINCQILEAPAPVEALLAAEKRYYPDDKPRIKALEELLLEIKYAKMYY